MSFPHDIHLARDEAERAITHLKQLQEIRDSKPKVERKERQRRQAAAKAPSSRLREIKAKFLALLQGDISGADPAH